MKTKAMLAMVIAAIMVIAVVPLGLSDNDADGTVGGTFNFYVYESTEDDDGDVTGSWTSFSGIGYNAYLALIGTDMGGTTDNISDSSFTRTVTSDYGDYTTINPNYGLFTKFNGSENSTSSSWTVYIYSEVQEAWVQGNTNALGFYKPYQDYDSEFRTANIAMYYGTPASSDLAALPTTGLQSLIDVQGNSAYKFTFHIETSTANPGTSHVSASAWTYMNDHAGTYYGYGSDAYLALTDALGSTVGKGNVWDYDNNTINYNYYGQFTGLLGVSQVSYIQDSTSYYYYYSTYLGTSTTSYASFMLGFYTASDAGVDTVGDSSGTSAFVSSVFTIKYVQSAY